MMMASRVNDGGRKQRGRRGAKKKIAEDPKLKTVRDIFRLDGRTDRIEPKKCDVTRSRFTL
jgi:hypothetical protein